MRIVSMEPCHVPQVAALERVCFSSPWSENSIAGELSNPLSLWLVAIEDGQLAGYVGSQSVMGESDMMNLAVDPAFRCRGAGRALVLALVEQLAQKGNHCLSLEVRASNAPALALYQGLGFAQVGRRPNYYRSPKEDGLILRKEWEI